MEGQRLNAPLNTWRTDRPEVRIRRVCASCNNGWMSRLERRVMPLITRLLDEPRSTSTLDIHDCRMLSLWAGKTSMVFESVNGPDHWLYSDLDRSLMAQRDLIPPLTDVWIAKCVGFPSTYSTGRNLSTAASPVGESQVRASVTTLAFSSLTIQVRRLVLSPAMDPMSKITVGQRLGPWERIVLQVWPLPAEPVHWPAAVGIAGIYGLGTLGDRFGPAMQDSPPTV